MHLHFPQVEVQVKVLKSYCFAYLNSESGNMISFERYQSHIQMHKQMNESNMSIRAWPITIIHILLKNDLGRPIDYVVIDVFNYI